MKLTAYETIIKASKEKVQEALAPLRAREMKKKAEMETAKIESEMISQEQKIQELAAAYPINFASMIDAIDQLALMERRKKQFARIIDEMFP